MNYNHKNYSENFKKFFPQEEIDKMSYNEKFIKCSKCDKKPEARWRKCTGGDVMEGKFYPIAAFRGKNGEEVCHKCAPCVKCGKENYGNWFSAPHVKTSDNPSGEWALAYCSVECFNGTEKPRQVENCNYCGKLTQVKFGNTNTEKAFCSRDCYVAAGNKIQKGNCRIAGCSQKAYYECMDLCLSHSKPCRGTRMGKKCNLALGSDEGDFCERCKNQDNEKQVSHLFKFTDQITGKGIDSSNWDHFYYIFTSSDGETIQVNAQNPAIGKQTLPRKDGNEKEGINYWYKISWKETEKDKWNFEEGDFIEIEKYEQSPKSNFKTIKFEDNLLKPTENSPVKTDNQTLIINLKSIKQITLTSDNNLVIEFNKVGTNSASQEAEIVNDEQIGSSQELQKIKSYLQESGEKSVNQQKLNSIFSFDNTNPGITDKPDNYTLAVGLSVIFVLGGLTIGYLVRRKLKVVRK